jgi:hypothetical protein
MRMLWRAYTLEILLCATFSLAAQPLQTNPSGKHCGSDFTENLVPDTLFGCELAKACEVHDVCYGKCNPGQPLAGSDYCKKSEFSWIRIKAKFACDANLKKDIELANKGRAECVALGSIYATAVTIAGQGPFNGRRIDQNGLRALVETTSNPEEAIAIFSHMAGRSQKGEVDLSTLRAKDDVLTFEAPKTLDGLVQQKQLNLQNEDQAKKLQQLQLQQLKKK